MKTKVRSGEKGFEQEKAKMFEVKGKGYYFDDKPAKVRKYKGLTKEEQLRKVFISLISEYIHKNIPIDLHNIEVLSNLLVKEVTIRTKL